MVSDPLVAAGPSWTIRLCLDSVGTVPHISAGMLTDHHYRIPESGLKLRHETFLQNWVGRMAHRRYAAPRNYRGRWEWCMPASTVLRGPQLDEGAAAVGCCCYLIFHLVFKVQMGHMQPVVMAPKNPFFHPTPSFSPPLSSHLPPICGAGWDSNP